MFPIGDDQIHKARTPFVNWILIILNVIFFIYEISLGSQELQVFIGQFGVVPKDVQNGHHLYSLFTSMFLHGGWMHLIGNMMFLYVFGDNIEHDFNHLGYLIFYISGGLIASFAHIYTNLGSTVPSIGASGAIAAALGAYLVLYPKSRIRMLVFLGFFITTIRVGAIFFLFFWIAMQLFYGMASLSEATAQTTGVAWWAHIGGFAFGLLSGILFRIFRR